MASAGAHRLAAVAGQRHVEPVVAQDPLERLPYGGLVVDHQDAHVVAMLTHQPESEVNRLR